jgi:hypothetical protein
MPTSGRMRSADMRVLKMSAFKRKKGTERVSRTVGPSNPSRLQLRRRAARPGKVTAGAAGRCSWRLGIGHFLDSLFKTDMAVYPQTSHIWS